MKKYTNTYLNMILESKEPLEIYQTFINKSGKFSQSKFQAYLEAAQQIVNTYFTQIEENPDLSSNTEEEKKLASDILDQTKILTNMSAEEVESFARAFLNELKEIKEKENNNSNETE